MRRWRGTPLALWFGLASALALVAAEPAALAHSPKTTSKRWRPPVEQPLVSVSLESARGGALPSVRHRGKTFVAGEHGDRYEVRITNNSGHRLEVVVSVDGLDVVSGRPGDFTRQRGYVLAPFGSVVIDGFRTSLDRVAAFRFSDVGDSFAAQVGAPQNAGVIGIAVFKERPAPIVRRHHAPRAGASRSATPDMDPAPRAKPRSTTKSKKADAKRSRAPSAGSSADARSERWSAPSRELGTRFGESRRSAVREVSFTRANTRRPDFRTSIFYDSARGLEARGVPIFVDRGWTRPAPVEPAEAWPSAREDRFAQPPPGWRGPR